MDKDSAKADHHIEITGTLDRHGVEILQIELRRLSKRHGIEIKGIRVERREKRSLPEFP